MHLGRVLHFSQKVVGATLKGACLSIVATKTFVHVVQQYWDRRIQLSSYMTAGAIKSTKICSELSKFFFIKMFHLS